MQIALKLPARGGSLGFALVLSHWRQPISNIADSLPAMHKNDMRRGDLQGANQCIHGYTFCYYYSGLCLTPLLEDLEKYSNLMIGFG